MTLNEAFEVPDREGGFESPKLVRDLEGVIPCPQEEGTRRLPSVLINGKVSAS